jgi:predicted Rossmann fold flavoprotein
MSTYGARHPNSERAYDVIVLGAGAAGLMCAAIAGQRNRHVALLDHNAQAGRKILISGGGRCNFTNIYCAPDRFLSENPHFAKSALALYTPHHFLEVVKRYGIAWHEKTLGQLFCDHSSRAILDMLLTECERSRIDLVLNARGIRVERVSGAFSITCAAGEFTSEALVVATGGLSIPNSEPPASPTTSPASSAFALSSRVPRSCRSSSAATNLRGLIWPASPPMCSPGPAFRRAAAPHPVSAKRCSSPIAA